MTGAEGTIPVGKYAFRWRRQLAVESEPDAGVVMQFEPLPGYSSRQTDVCVEWSSKRSVWGVNFELGDGTVFDSETTAALGFQLLAAANLADELNRRGVSAAVDEVPC